MKKFLVKLRAAAVALAAFAAMLVPEGALAQVVTALPIYTQNNVGQIIDLGNGPTELRVVQGNAQIWTMQGSGVGSTSGSATLLTLTATPATPPCVGCIISGAGVTSGTTITAYGGGLTATLSAAMTVAAATPLAWGAACPASLGSIPAMLVQAGVGNDLPMYTQARVCASAQFGAGATLLPFAIGAH